LGGLSPSWLTDPSCVGAGLGVERIGFDHLGIDKGNLHETTESPFGFGRLFGRGPLGHACAGANRPPHRVGVMT